jgi:hypothetical protein
MERCARHSVYAILVVASEPLVQVRRASLAIRVPKPLDRLEMIAKFVESSRDLAFFAGGRQCEVNGPDFEMFEQVIDVPVQFLARRGKMAPDPPRQAV